MKTIALTFAAVTLLYARAEGNNWSFEPPSMTKKQKDKRHVPHLPIMTTGGDPPPFRHVLHAPSPARPLFFARFSEAFVSRAEYVAKTRIHAEWVIAYLAVEEELRSRGINQFDYFNQTGERVFTRGATLALRQVAVEDTFVREAGSDMMEHLRRFARSSFGGQEERGMLPSLQSPEEGLFFADRVRKPTGLRFFFRPLSVGSPYVGWSYGRPDGNGENLYTLNLRYYYREWQDHAAEVIGEAPLLHQWFLFGSMRARARGTLRTDGDFANDGDILRGAVGVRGPAFRGAELYLKTDLYPQIGIFLALSFSH